MLIGRALLTAALINQGLFGIDPMWLSSRPLITAGAHIPSSV